MEPSIAIRELCSGQSRAYLISPRCTSVQFFEDKDIPRGNQKFLSSMARVCKSFGTYCLSYASTFTVHCRPPINYYWSNKFIWREFPIWTRQQYIQWSCMNSLIRIWMSWHQCWRFWEKIHKKGGSCICSQRLYSISAYVVDLPLHKLDI